MNKGEEEEGEGGEGELKQKYIHEEKLNSAVNKYYALKMKYESEINSLKKKINIGLNSNREKRNAFVRLKIKCINCRRPVKSIFQTIYNEKTGSRSLIAKCGDVVSPCGLKININVGYCEMLTDSIPLYENMLSNIKNDIIKEKNNTLFGYTTNEQAISNFNKMKEDVTEFTETLETYYYLYLNKMPKKEYIANLQYKVYEFINAIKKQVEANNPENAIDIYLSDLNPILSKLMKLKYHLNMVEFDEKKEVYTLIQRATTPHDFEELYGNPKIISYDTDLLEDESDEGNDGDDGNDGDEGNEGDERKVKKTKKQIAKKPKAPKASKVSRAPKEPKATKASKASKKEKEKTEKQTITLRVKNNKPIDWGNSDDDEDDDDDDENEQLERAQQEREIEQEH
jgi:hypothetical protein